MSRVALVTIRRQSAHDKTCVSSINKRRVISVPEEGAASAEAGASGLDRSGAPLEVWTRRSPRVARPRPSSPRGGLGATPLHPICMGGVVSSGCRTVAWIAFRAPFRRGPDCPPTVMVPRGADPDGPLPSGPVPAPSLPWKRSTGSSTVGVAPRASIARDSTLALSHISQAALTSSGTPHDDAIPVDLRPSDPALARILERTSTTLARGLGPR
jgi:hypothetical protein